jgi:hypothetical protein
MTEPPASFKTAQDFCAEFVPPSYAIEPIVRSGSLYTVTARTGSGKTAFLITTALAVATGRPDVLGREVTRGRVAYIAAENPDDLRMRLMVAAWQFNIDLSEICHNLLIMDRGSVLSEGDESSPITRSPPPGSPPLLRGSAGQGGQALTIQSSNMRFSHDRYSRPDGRGQFRDRAACRRAHADRLRYIFQELFKFRRR